MSQPDQTGPAWAASRNTAWNAAPDGGVRSAIARAAQSTGVDFTYLAAQARLESAMNPNAHAATSSASGLFQFTSGTWLTMLQRHGDMLGMSAGGTRAALADPAARAQLLALRNDPQAAAMMAAGLASDNQSALGAVLGRVPDAGELYLASFLGADGAGRFLGAMAANPDQPAAGLFARAAAANTAIFYDGDGQARSLGQVMALLRGKMDRALQAEGGAGMDPAAYAYGGLAIAGNPVLAAAPAVSAVPAAPATPWADGGPLARQFAAARQQMAGDDAGVGGVAGAGAVGAMPVGQSMAETVMATFGGDGAGATPEFVRNAYGRLRAFGL